MKTTCCNAYTSIDETGVFYCKACYGYVDIPEIFRQTKVPSPKKPSPKSHKKS